MKKCSITKNNLKKSGMPMRQTLAAKGAKISTKKKSK
jgi:hypothetical protein